MSLPPLAPLSSSKQTNRCQQLPKTSREASRLIPGRDMAAAHNSLTAALSNSCTSQSSWGEATLADFNTFDAPHWFVTT